MVLNEDNDLEIVLKNNNNSPDYSKNIHSKRNGIGFNFSMNETKLFIR